MYLKSQGWDVHYISCRGGQVYIDGLEPFIVGTFPMLRTFPFILPFKLREQVINDIIRSIPVGSGETVIETGTFYTSYWGEMLAQRMNARHVIVYLDEHNMGIRERQADFFRFKYDRDELACISKAAYEDVFSPFCNKNENHTHVLPCFCTNSLEDIQSSIVSEVIHSDYTIGYVGRLEKDAFRALVRGIREFSAQHPQANISLNCFGDFGRAEDRTNFLEEMAELTNVQTYISGFVFPIPKKAVEKCDLCFGSAGSIVVPLKANVPTIGIDVYTNLPNGFRINVEKYEYERCTRQTSVCDYLNVFFIEGYRPHIHNYDLSRDQIRLAECMQEHMDFLQNTKDRLEYYDISQIPLSLKERTKKYAITLFGYENFNKIKDLMRKRK